MAEQRQELLSIRAALLEKGHTMSSFARVCERSHVSIRMVLGRKMKSAYIESKLAEVLGYNPLANGTPKTNPREAA